MILRVLSILLTTISSHAVDVDPLTIPPKPETYLSNISLRLQNIRRYITGRIPIQRHHLPPCFVDDGGLNSEWGERMIAEKWTKGYCTSVLELGGGGGSVSTVIQMNLSDKRNHVVVQPSEEAMFGGLHALERNRKACEMQFTIIDHVLQKGESGKLLSYVNKPFDCMVVDCENCLVGEFEKNPDLFTHVKYIQVERDDKEPLNAARGSYDALFEKLKFTKIDSGIGCRGKCATEVWGRSLL